MKVASPSASSSRTTRTWSGLVSSSLSLEQIFSTVLLARSADSSDRAHSSTSPARAAVAARPQAIAPEPAIPNRSCNAPPDLSFLAPLPGPAANSTRRSVRLLARADQKLVDGHVPWPGEDVEDRVGNVAGFQPLDIGEALADLFPDLG